MFLQITNEPRKAAWGSRSLIADYLGREPSGGPEAELWLGAHPQSPSLAADSIFGVQTLPDVLRERGAAPPRLLLKVLAAAAPLSLQVHPTTERARAGFQREDAAGIARDAPERSYRDPFAKPELIVAVTRFEALCGFREPAATLAVFRAFADVDDRVAPVVEHLQTGDALEWALKSSPEAVAACAGVTRAAREATNRFPAEADTVRRIAPLYEGDTGLLIALMLNRVSLAPGEALYLPAGNVHAYLEGLGIELMGPSDNVLRGGLTEKHVDAHEFLAVADRSPLADPRLPVRQIPGAVAYEPAAPFALMHIDGGVTVQPGVRAVLLSVADDTRVRGLAEAQTGDGSGEVSLAKADAAWIDGEGELRISSSDAWLAVERDTPEEI